MTLAEEGLPALAHVFQDAQTRLEKKKKEPGLKDAQTRLEKGNHLSGKPRNS